MSDPIKRSGLRPQFWDKVPLTKMSPAEWEALCDGCGKCCLNKLEDEDTGDVVFTTVACRLLDDTSCRCAHYENRKALVPECVVLTPKTLPDIAYWMPKTCAYRRLHEGKDLPEWHPLRTGDPASVRDSGHSVQGRTVSEFDIPVEDWENYLIDEEV